MSKNKKYSYISLFSSSGVGCYGFKLNGFHCVATNELITRRLEVQKNNKKCISENAYVNGDILEKSTTDKIMSLVDDYKKSNAEGIDFLIATPPCQGISLANHKKTKSDKIRNSLVVESIKLTHLIKPNVFVYENVRGFLNTICSDSDGFDKNISEAIENHLSDEYIISSRVVNFKYYGVPSSRTRTLIIGVKKGMHNIHPNFLFPYKRNIVTLKDSIGHLPSINEPGGFMEDDFLHNCKTFDTKMLPWIENLKEGDSAFDNIEESRIPHIVKEGVRVVNANKNGDKYKRQRWDFVGPCVHTRNDTFSSQNTIHPTDNRVFSIRELMIMMSIPYSFTWFDRPIEDLQKLTKNEKKSLLKKNEINIRQSIGESVPTKVFFDIAKQYSDLHKVFSEKQYNVDEIDNYLRDINKLLSEIKNEEVSIKLIYPDVLTILIIYNSAILFEKKKINIEIVSTINLLEKLDIPNHFFMNKGISKGDLKLTWLKDKMDSMEFIFNENDNFDNSLIFSSFDLLKNPMNALPIIKHSSLEDLNIWLFRINKGQQLSFF